MPSELLHLCYIPEFFTTVTKLKAWKLEGRKYGSDL